MIGTKTELNSTTVTLTECDVLEQTAVCIETNSGRIFICAVYLPPNSDPVHYETHTAGIQQLTSLAKDCDKLIVLGDYNLPNLCWRYDDEMNCFLPTNASTEPELALVESMLLTGLQQQNNFVNDNGKLLDLVFMNPAYADIFEPTAPLLKIDVHHKPIVLKFDVESTFFEEEFVRFDFDRCDRGALNGLIEQIDWNQLLGVGSVDEPVGCFYDELFNIFRANVPLRKSKRNANKHQPWWNANLRNLRNRLRKARKRK